MLYPRFVIVARSFPKKRSPNEPLNPLALKCWRRTSCMIYQEKITICLVSGLKTKFHQLKMNQLHPILKVEAFSPVTRESLSTSIPKLIDHQGIIETTFESLRVPVLPKWLFPEESLILMYSVELEPPSEVVKDPTILPGLSLFP